MFGPDNNQVIGRVLLERRLATHSSPAGLLYSHMSPDTSSSSESSDILNLEDDEGWEDVEPDVEKVKIVSLFGKDEFDDVQTMLQRCKDSHQFDFIKIRKELGVCVFVHLLGVMGTQG